MNAASTSWRHPVNVTQLVLGLVFLGVAGTWALVAADVLGTDQLEWVLPLLLVLAGTVGLVAVVAKGMTREKVSAGTDEGPGWVGEDDDVADLEATAYAPYAADLDRTRALQAEERAQAARTTDRTTHDEGDAR